MLDRVDLILLMTVNPGFGGQAFIPEVVDKVRAGEGDGRRTAPIDIEIDGGMTPETAPLVDRGRRQRAGRGLGRVQGRHARRLQGQYRRHQERRERHALRQPPVGLPHRSERTHQHDPAL